MVDFRQRADHAGCNRRASRTPCGCAPRALSSEIVQTQGTRLNRISLARGRSRFLFRQASKTSYGRVAIADFCAQPRVVFQRRPRSRRSSNEVAPSAGGGGGARDLRSRFSSSSPVRRVVSAVIGRSRPSLGRRFFLSPLRCSASPALSVPLGTPTGVLQSLKGVGDGPNFLRGQAEKAGVSQGGGNPLGCVLCLLSVASQKVGAPAARAGKR